jgi:hypothetical protein
VSMMVIRHEAASEEEAARVCAHGEAVGAKPVIQLAGTAVFGEYAGRVLDLARRTGKTT